MSSRRILITGGTGFIGSYLLREAIDQGYEVYAAVRRQSNRCALAGLPIHLLEVDYSDTEQMAKAIRDIPHTGDEAPFEYVIHCAGLTKTTQLDDFMRVNADQTHHLIQALEAQKVLPKRFVLMSSMGSYGINPTNGPMTVDMPQCPDTAYGRSKLKAEQYIKASDMSYTIFCPTGVYGAGEEDYFMSITAMMRGWSFVAGRTPQLLSFVYVKDVVRAVFFALQHEETAGHSYLLSDGKDYIDSDFTNAVASIVQKKIREIRVPLPVIKAACILGQTYSRITHHSYALNKDKYPILSHRNWLCDISPLMALGFEPQYDLEAGLRETYQLTDGFKKDNFNSVNCKK